MNIPPIAHRLIIVISSVFLLFGCAHPSVPKNEPLSNAPLQTPPPAKNVTVAAPSLNPLVTDNASVSEETDTTTADEDATVQSDDNSSADEQNSSSADGENSDDKQALLDTALEMTERAQEYWDHSDMEHALDTLDQAYALILKVPAGNPDLAQQKEDLRFVISKRIVEMYAARQTTVKGTSAAIPMVVNDHVTREIQSFQTIERSFFIEAYKRSGRYRGEMVKALKEAGMPEELSWLPLIESGFKVRAMSRSRALGLWQFIPSTGYKYGLKRNAWIDERLDPEKSTAAAIAYFKELHSMFGDWATVLAAYNCGEGSVARVIRDQKVDYLDNFWDFYERLPQETARYFPRFLAVLTILKDPAHYGFNLNEIDGPLSYETVTIEKPVHLKSVAEKLGIDQEELTELNPELRRDATPNTTFALRVPPGKGDLVLTNIDKMPTWSPPKVEYVMHRVRRGETLTRIAIRYRTSAQRIMQANNLRSGKMLRVGQRLKIPMRGTT
ncbi:MAG TPA: transglycosylase SLT domain-containing protein [Nitrospirota bacterium]|nr:transglycosylase SLT domain-containing protein [Nitrospirota bacterium]